MAWTITSVGKSSTTKGSRDNVFIKAVETVTLPSSSPETSSSVIDWIPKGQDFTVIANSGGSTLSASCDIDVTVCDTATGTFVRLKSDLVSTVSDAAKAALYDVSANGEAPYYKLLIDPEAIMASGDTITFVVMA